MTKRNVRSKISSLLFCSLTFRFLSCLTVYLSRVCAYLSTNQHSSRRLIGLLPGITSACLMHIYLHNRPTATVITLAQACITLYTVTVTLILTLNDRTIAIDIDSRKDKTVDTMGIVLYVVL